MKKTFICLFAVTVLALSACASGDKPADKATEKSADKTTVEKKADTTKAVAKTPEFVTTNSGLKYLDTQVGTGAEAKTGSQVLMHYTVWLYVDGQKKGNYLDSSLPSGKPYPVKLGARAVIAGWDEGIVGMKVGGKRTLIVPPQLAYGPNDYGGGMIPGNSTLIFELELMDSK